ncbi:hypothetical protein PRZ48_008544 [Zasmidium cellare]|uniref:EthD domain-containing protein n=1 Tax=Zasmidium cellare TaxID=395010 RepID=A0ABR0EGT7_ZASCE|nr:hypothetical protein PRZ48_008544 [Zasmidium cellare]
MPDLFFVLSRLKEGSDVTEETYTDFYDNEHLPDMVAYRPKVCDVAVRYRKRIVNAAAEAPETFPHLALYPTEDVKALIESGQEGPAEKTRHVKLLGGRDVYEFAEFQPRICVRLTSHESPSKRDNDGSWPRTLIVLYTSLTDPRLSGAMDGTKGHLRSTLYKQINGILGEMVIGEFDCAPDEVEADKALLSLRRMFQTRLDCTIDVFELQKVVGDSKARL